jgi:hypothetical protein
VAAVRGAEELLLRELREASTEAALEALARVAAELLPPAEPSAELLRAAARL